MRNVNDVIDAFEKGDELKFKYFYGGLFSQWASTPFDLCDICYYTAEHYMMAEKARLFHDDLMWKRIVTIEDPRRAKQYGRRVRGFNQSMWDECKFKIVVKGNYEKFKQNKEAQEYLKRYMDHVIVEASPFDSIWGVGLSVSECQEYNDPYYWKGENLLGFAIMEARDRLKLCGII
jgi:ribA/ribD-fused uncharacterized protein